ncbi:Predicted protein [Taphrina deformans PYCC 5710]|uniref:Uncharacterized protein n=1 Tax=Taphrina deformans (strain PYCC 5710 / ATCC 11124 / CBS 356.35 / IMI 108563 / JCM 9778 / NBRC 8474) TaxID=1097556 RepID=R4XCB9_TAPDE|nr:Predicted protein [Taphrina deformans PYCC 5710]|eukprot:CCG83226.1 Predicted protein [Taphrina deformans PYCC 5710]
MSELPSTILFLGAPSNQRLQNTWRAEYLTLPFTTLSQEPAQVSWRRLATLDDSHSIVESGKGKDGTTDEPYAQGESHRDTDALNTSYSLYLTGTTDFPTHDSLTDNPTTSLDTVLPTPPLPTFDMSVVLDLEDLQHVPVPDRAGKPPRLHSTLAAVMHLSEPRQIVTRAGVQTQMVVLTLGDVTSNGFELAVWGLHADSVLKSIRRLDVLLIQDFILSKYQDVLGGTSRQGRTRFTVLYRIDRRTPADDALRPLLLDDLQSERVRSVRDWVVTWIPSDTQPEHTQVSFGGQS